MNVLLARGTVVGEAYMSSLKQQHYPGPFSSLSVLFCDRSPHVLQKHQRIIYQKPTDLKSTIVRLLIRAIPSHCVISSIASNHSRLIIAIGLRIIRWSRNPM